MRLLYKALAAFAISATIAHPDDEHTPDDVTNDDICGFLEDRGSCRAFGRETVDGVRLPGACTWLAGSDTCVAAIPDDAPDDEYCGQFDGMKPKCGNDERCDWDPSTGSCIPAGEVTCDMHTDSGRGCKAMDGCTFIAATGACVADDDVTCDMYGSSRRACTADSGCSFINGQCIATDEITCRVYDGAAMKCKSDDTCIPVGDLCCTADDITGSCPELDDLDCGVQDEAQCKAFSDVGLCKYIVMTVFFLGEKTKEWKCIGGEEETGGTLVSPCTPINPCSNDGTCNMIDVDNFTCDCVYPYVGDTCDAVDNCSQDACKNGSACTDNGGLENFSCACDYPYSGDICDGTTYCVLADGTGPCMNGSACSEESDRYVCTCSYPWFIYSGDGDADNCTDTKYCAIAPCNNGGTCDEESDRYVCTCPYPYVGETCDDTDYCSNTPCGDSSNVCTDTGTDYVCACAYPYVGATCDSTVYCELADGSSPCGQGAACSEEVGGFNCACAYPWAGNDTCTATNYCSTFSCQNGGTCSEGSGTGVCACSSSYQGTNCQTRVGGPQCMNARFSDNSYWPGYPPRNAIDRQSRSSAFAHSRNTSSQLIITWSVPQPITRVGVVPRQDTGWWDYGGLSVSGCSIEDWGATSTGRVQSNPYAQIWFRCNGTNVNQIKVWNNGGDHVTVTEIEMYTAAGRFNNSC